MSQFSTPANCHLSTFWLYTPQPCTLGAGAAVCQQASEPNQQQTSCWPHEVLLWSAERSEGKSGVSNSSDCRGHRLRQDASNGDKTPQMGLCTLDEATHHFNAAHLCVCYVAGLQCYVVALNESFKAKEGHSCLHRPSWVVGTEALHTNMDFGAETWYYSPGRLKPPRDVDFQCEMPLTSPQAENW